MGSKTNGKAASSQLRVEFEAMEAVAFALDPIDQVTRDRVLAWALGRFGSGEELAESEPEKPKRGRVPGESLKARSHRETVELARSLGMVRDKDVAQRYGITLSGARQRLYSCQAAGLLDRVAPNLYAIPELSSKKLEGMEIHDDLLSALVNLGYRQRDAKKICETAIVEVGPTATLQELIEHVLKEQA